MATITPLSVGMAPQHPPFWDRPKNDQIWYGSTCGGGGCLSGVDHVPVPRGEAPAASPPKNFGRLPSSYMRAHSKRNSNHMVIKQLLVDCEWRAICFR